MMNTITRAVWGAAPYLLLWVWMANTPTATWGDFLLLLFLMGCTDVRSYSQGVKAGVAIARKAIGERMAELKAEVKAALSDTKDTQ